MGRNDVHNLGRRLSTVAAILTLAAVYFGAAKFGLALAFVNANATAVRPRPATRWMPFLGVSLVNEFPEGGRAV